MSRIALAIRHVASCAASSRRSSVTTRNASARRWRSVRGG